MKWKIVTAENSPNARKLALMLGIEVCREEVEGTFDGLIIFSVSPWNRQVMEKPEFRNVPKIFYWTGTDVVYLLNENSNPSYPNTIHLTDSPLLVEKLLKKFPEVHFAPLPPYLPVTDIPIKEPGVLIYITQHLARDVDRTKDLIRAIPDLPIHIIKGKGRSIIDSRFQSNITSYDYITESQKRELFSKVSVYVRLMNFDGLSLLVVEMKALGRHVLYTNPAPFCDLITQDEAIDRIAHRIRERFNSPLDTEGAKWYQSIFSKETFLKVVQAACKAKGWEFNYG